MGNHTNNNQNQISNNVILDNASNNNSINIINSNSNIIHSNNNNMMNINNSLFPHFIWIDYNINSEENSFYKMKLKNKNFSLIECHTIEQGLTEIKKIKFEKVILMLSKRMFNDFINSFEKEKNEICCSLNIIVFTKREKKNLIEEICNNSKKISSGYLFNKTNIFYDFHQIEEFLNKKYKSHSPHFEIIDEDNKFYYNEKMDCYEKIENFENLILPIYFHKIIEPITLEEIHSFNYYLSTSFKEAQKLISDFESIPEMPIEIVCKYWAKIYTLEAGKFYSILNKGLRDKKFKLFLPFVKMMYEGVKKKSLIPITNEKLYSGGIIMNKELELLRNNLNSNINNNDLPNVIYYFKSFKSFSKKKEQAEKFMKNRSNDSTLIMFIIKENNNIEEEFISNAYIKEYSKYPQEEEVLFFPFSAFEVENIEDENNHVNIYLKYLGRYKSYIEDKKRNPLADIPISQFGRDINEMGLIKYKFHKFWEVKEELLLDKDSSCLLCLKKNIILISVGKIIKLYRLNSERVSFNIDVHNKEINDLLKINENIFISSSEDQTIKFIKLFDNFSGYNILKNIKIHLNAVNQTINLRRNNLYASCSNDNSIKVFKYDVTDDKNNDIIVENSLYNNNAFLTICELTNFNIISISKDGNLKFWEYKDYNYNNIMVLKGFRNCLHNCIFLINDEIVLIGTKKNVIFVNAIKMQKIKKYSLDYNAYSICYFKGSIFLGLKDRINSCLLYEYKTEIINEETNLECIGKGRDIVQDKITYICALDEKTISTSNNNKFIKIWKETEKKPETLLFGNNQIYNLDEDYDSDNVNLDITPGGENEIIGGNNETPRGDDENQDEVIKNNMEDIKTPKGEVDISSEIKINNPFGENKMSINKDNNQDIKNDKTDNLNLTINFEVENGLKTTLSCEKEMTLEQLFILFFKKINFEEINDSESNILFLYNSKELYIKDKAKIKDILKDNSKIVVIDKNECLSRNKIDLKTSKGQEYKISVYSKESMHTLFKKYLEKIGKPEILYKFNILKDINFEDFLKKLSE